MRTCFFVCLTCLFSCFTAGAEITQEESSSDNSITHPLDLSLWDDDLFEFEEDAAVNPEGNSQNNRLLPPAEEERECVWSLKIALENEDDSLGNTTILSEGSTDRGYTHGHITSLVRACPKGDDLSISLSSKLYTSLHGWDLSSLEDGETIEIQQWGEGSVSFITDRNRGLFLHRNGYLIGENAEKPTKILNSEEETRLRLEWSNWRDFNHDFYNKLGIFLGRLSVNDNFVLAGLEQRLIHDILEGVGYIKKYKYRRGGEIKNFVGTLIAFGKTIPLSREGLLFGRGPGSGEREILPQSRSVCSSPCFAYIVGEAGLELASDEDLTFIYIASELNKAFVLSHTGEVLAGASVGVKAKKYPFEGGYLWETSIGLNVRLVEGVFLNSQIKKRNILSEGYYLTLDWDDEPIFSLELGFRL